MGELKLVLVPDTPAVPIISELAELVALYPLLELVVNSDVVSSGVNVVLGAS